MLLIAQSLTEADGLSRLEQWGIISAVLFGLLGTVLGLFNAFVAWTSQRARLKVSAGFAVLSPGTGEMLLKITAANTGARDVTISACGFIIPNQQRLYVQPARQISSPIPRKLAPGEGADVYFPAAEMAREILRSGLPAQFPVQPYFNDQTGRTWSVRRRDISTVNLDSWLEQ